MKFRDLEEQADKKLDEYGCEVDAITIIQIASSVIPKDWLALVELAEDDADLIEEPPEINMGGLDTVVDLLAWKVFEAIEDYLWVEVQRRKLD